MSKILKNLLKTIVLAVIILTGIFSNLGMRFESDTDSALKNEDETNLPDASDIFDQGVLHSESQEAIGINETAIYSETSQITLGNGSNPEYTSQNESFPMDVANSWLGYKYSAEISGISDENDWISNGNFGSDDGITYSAHNVQTFQSSHPYSNNLDSDPTIGGNIIATIDGSGCDFMRLHFVNISTEPVVDILYLWDQDNNFLEWYSGTYNDLTSHWLEASSVKITLETNPTVSDYGFYIDYYETYNGLLFSVDSNNWTHHENIYYTSLVEADAVVSHQLNNSAVNVTLVGEPGTGDSFSYYRQDSSGVYQELAIPRGKVIDAWFSMDYNMLRGIDNNEMIIYFMIDDQIIYQRGFHTIATEGIAQWHTTGAIPLSSWLNGTTLFSGNLDDQIVNISIGVQATKIRTYSGEHSNLQEVYFDNIELFFKAAVNSTNPGVNLKIDNLPAIDSISQWGSATFTKFHIWNENPIQINLTTDALKIEFTLTSTIYGSHSGLSKLEEYGSQGSNVIIYTNNSVHWETYYRTYIPLYYDNFSFIGKIPSDWEIQHIYNPLGNNSDFLDGDKGAESFAVEHPDADYPGWWFITAQSTNMIDSSNTGLWNGTGWQNYLDPLYFNVSNTVRIKTSLNTSLGNIENNASTWANLTIYTPDGELWYSGATSPEISGEIFLPNLTIGELNSSAGMYQYSIVWTNGTSAGGLNGTFYVYRNLQATVFYPRDAIEDYETSEILGDIIPIRIKLNDSLSGDIANNLNVAYSWDSGTDNLIEIISGVYDGNFDTLELRIPGSHELNFTAWGFGYHNLTFSLTINLIEETELKITGVDNNIDYGTNFSIQMSYTSKHIGSGIPNASVSLNMSTSFYSVIPQATPGIYRINISSGDAFSSAGFYDIQLNVSKIHFQDQDLITRIQILPRSVYFKILIDSSDCTFNKSYSTYIKQNLNLSVGILSSAEDQLISTGNVYISDGEHIHDEFTVVDEHFYMELNTSHFGLGVHFISIIYNETSYQSASETIMLSISRLDLNATLYNTEQTLVIDRKNDFEVILYIEDPLTHLPVTDANVSYNWIYGRGLLSNLGDGMYKFEDASPNQIGSYEITFTITSPNADYESSEITMTLVSQVPPGSQNLWWILIVVGAVALITTVILLYIAYQQKVLVPQHDREVDLLRKKTQVFDDITIIKSILLIETGSGRLMYQKQFGGLEDNVEDIFSGFLHSILTLSNKFALKNGELGDKQEYAEFTHEAFHVLVASGEKVIIALILEEESSPELQERAFKFLDEFEGIYDSVFGNWNGDRSVFNDTTPKLFEEIFHLSLLNRFMLSEVQNIHLLEKKLVIPGTMTERVSQIIKAVTEERHDFRLRTLISLVPKEDQLEAKDVILRFIKNKYLIPVVERNT